MKWKLLKPYVLQLIPATMVYLVAPIILYTKNIVQISVSNEYNSFSVAFVIAAAGIYFLYLTSSLIPGISSIADLLTDNFVTSTMVYMKGHIDRRNIFAVSKNISLNCGLTEKYRFLILEMDDGARKSTYLTTNFYNLQQGARYSVKYGKFSKVIVSILSEQGEQIQLYSSFPSVADSY